MVNEVTLLPAWPRYVENVFVINSANVTIKGVSFETNGNMRATTLIDLFSSTVFVVMTVTNGGGDPEPIAQSEGTTSAG